MNKCSCPCHCSREFRRSASARARRWRGTDRMPRTEFSCTPFSSEARHRNLKPVVVDWVAVEVFADARAVAAGSSSFRGSERQADGPVPSGLLHEELDVDTNFRPAAVPSEPAGRELPRTSAEQPVIELARNRGPVATASRGSARRRGAVQHFTRGIRFPRGPRGLLSCFIVESTRHDKKKGGWRRGGSHTWSRRAGPYSASR